MRITPDSGHLDVFGEADTVLPAGKVVHVEGMPARLAADTRVQTHPGNTRLLKARRMAEAAKKRKKCAAMAEGTGPERHSAKAHRCVDQVRAKGHGESSAWAICTTSIGKRGVYAKGHGGNANPKGKVKEYNHNHGRDGKFAAGKSPYRVDDEYGGTMQYRSKADADRAAEWDAMSGRGSFGHMDGDGPRAERAARAAARKGSEKKPSARERRDGGAKRTFQAYIKELKSKGKGTLQDMSAAEAEKYHRLRRAAGLYEAKIVEAREAAVAAACRRFETEFGTLTQEAWTDAARAASIAARKAKAMGKNWHKAARSAFRKAVQLSQGFDPAVGYKQAAAQANTQSFGLLPRGTTGARGILKQARVRAERHSTTDQSYWLARKTHISKMLNHKSRRFATA